MNDNYDQKQFADDLGHLVQEAGLGPSMGRVLGLLLISEPRQLSAEQIQTQLSLSSGSVSMATTFLCQSGFINRVTKQGTRKHYYEADEACWERTAQIRLSQILRGIELADRGLKIRPADNRLVGMRRLYAEFEAPLKKFINEQ